MLAYYKSQEEVGLGSRGSVKMACCEISGLYMYICMLWRHSGVPVVVSATDIRYEGPNSI